MARNLCRHGMNGTPAGVSLALQAPTPRPPSQLERACRCVRKYYRKRCIPVCNALCNEPVIPHIDALLSA
jgi:hypothetical protein